MWVWVVHVLHNLYDQVWVHSQIVFTSGQTQISSKISTMHYEWTTSVALPSMSNHFFSTKLKIMFSFIYLTALSCLSSYWQEMENIQNMNMKNSHISFSKLCKCQHVLFLFHICFKSMTLHGLSSLVLYKGQTSFSKIHPCQIIFDWTWNSQILHGTF